LIFIKFFVIIFIEKEKKYFFIFYLLPFLNAESAARFGTKRVEFSIIPPPADFVKQKMKKNYTRSDPGIGATFTIDFYKKLLYNKYIR